MIQFLQGYKPIVILSIVGVISVSSGAIGFIVGKAMTAAELQGEVVNLTRNLGQTETSLATCNGAVLSLEQATLSAGRAREQAESIAAELTKRNQRVVTQVKTIKASSCLEMVNKLIEVGK